MLKITTPSRLHLTLIDMNASIGRVDGGIGLTLDEPVICISAGKSDIVEITGMGEHAERMRIYLNWTLQRLCIKNRSMANKNG